MTIKSIETQRFTVTLVDIGGAYVVEYATLSGAHRSEDLKDLNTALLMFDLKLADLEGV